MNQMYTEYHSPLCRLTSSYLEGTQWPFQSIFLEAIWYIAIFFLIAEKLCFEFEGLRKCNLCRSASGVQIYIFFPLVTLRDILGTLLIMLTEWCPLSVGAANMNHTTADISANFSLRSMPFSRPWEGCFTFSTLCKTLHITSISGFIDIFPQHLCWVVSSSYRIIVLTIHGLCPSKGTASSIRGWVWWNSALRQEGCWRSWTLTPGQHILQA